MDWYARLEHYPGCDLAYIRDFVHPDTICSCYKSYLRDYLGPKSEDDTLFELILSSMMKPIGLSYYDYLRPPNFPVFRTMDLLPDRKQGRLFS